MPEDEMLEPLDESAEGSAMPDEELAAQLAEHEMRSIGYYESEIAQEQADALDRYYRRPYGDEREGRSKVVDGTVAITVDNALAAIIKPFASSDETVVFEPRGPEDEEVANQATEYVNYVLHQDNPGFLILHDWFKDALVQKLGVVKLYWKDTTKPKPERLENLDATQLQQLMAEEQVIGGPYGPDENGLYTLDVLHADKDGRLCIENVPPEEYRISPYARPGRTAPYEAHIRNMARSELIDMGFDPEIVEGLSMSTDALQDTRYQSRYQDETWNSTVQPTGDKSRELVQVNDEYVLIDYDGDGVSELRHVIRCDTTILFNEEVDEAPFATLCPIPMPHKVYGLSLADVTMEEQRIATVLTRQTLDNLYLANNPRIEIPKAAERADGTTIDDLLSPAPGQPIRTEAGGQLNPVAIPFVGDKSFPMLEYVKAEAEARTGISRQGQGLDPDAIDKAGQMSATQAALIADGRNGRAEMIARIFAETGIKRLFKLMLRMLVQHQPRERVIRLRNKWVPMDPREWNADMDVSISVGLGTGNKAEQIATAQGVLELMERVGQTPFGQLIDEEKVYNGLKRFLNASGIKNVDDFINEPQKDEQGNLVQQPPQPSPEEQKMQADMQMQAAKMQADQAKSQAELELAREKAALDAQIAQEQAAAKLELERQKAQAEMALAEQKMAMEAQLAERKMAMQERMAERDAMRRDSEAEAKLSTNRAGGDLDK